jgi:hypothetical protein
MDSDKLKILAAVSVVIVVILVIVSWWYMSRPAANVSGGSVSGGSVSGGTTSGGTTGGGTTSGGTGGGGTTSGGTGGTSGGTSGGTVITPPPVVVPVVDDIDKFVGGYYFTKDGPSLWWIYKTGPKSFVMYTFMYAPNNSYGTCSGNNISLYRAYNGSTITGSLVNGNEIHWNDGAEPIWYKISNNVGDCTTCPK